jgi:short-subunit dehydrogenase
MGSFAGKSVVLTGASEGIGRALALRLARDGARLTLVARSADRLRSLCGECTALGGDALAVPADLDDATIAKQVIAAATTRFGALDVLVNNAGITMWSRFEALENLEVLERLMRINYLASARLTAAALPALRASRGLIVAIASVAGLTGVPERTGYAASKHAMIGFFESLRIELAGSGVDVSIVAPDFVVSQIHRRALGADGRALGASPMRESRIMSAERCAELIHGAMLERRRLLITSWRGRFGRWLRLVAPTLVDRIAARAIRNRS